MTLQDSIELIGLMLREGILQQSHLDLRYLYIKLVLRGENFDVAEAGSQCIKLAKDVLLLDDDEMLPMIKNLLVIFECLSPIPDPSTYSII